MSDNTLQDKKILIIEDNTFLASVLSQKLSIHGAKASAYSNGLEGLAAVRTDKPDLVILDIIMPVMNGYEVLQVMHSEGLTEKTQVIVISNSGGTLEADRIKELGVSEYLVKAEFSADDVLEKVYKVLKVEPSKFSGSSEGSTSGLINDTNMPTDTVKNELPRVLIVEDDPLLRNLLSMKLSNSNCPAMFSNDGLQVNELIDSFAPNVIVLDLKLPGKDGFEILKDLKSSEKYQDIPVVIFSNNSSDEDRKRVTELGAEAYFVKAMTDLTEFIRELVKYAKS
ncbi:response regulator [Candidatus Kaiserbacteria bacterium]|nr:response regulator [Candidatus Kaiserbacteria bacterium]